MFWVFLIVVVMGSVLIELGGRDGVHWSRAGSGGEADDGSFLGYAG